MRLIVMFKLDTHGREEKKVLKNVLYWIDYGKNDINGKKKNYMKENNETYN